MSPRIERRANPRGFDGQDLCCAWVDFFGLLVLAAIVAGGAGGFAYLARAVLP